MQKKSILFNRNEYMNLFLLVQVGMGAIAFNTISIPFWREGEKNNFHF